MAMTTSENYDAEVAEIYDAKDTTLKLKSFKMDICMVLLNAMLLKRY